MNFVISPLSDINLHHLLITGKCVCMCRTCAVDMSFKLHFDAESYVTVNITAPDTSVWTVSKESLRKCSDKSMQPACNTGVVSVTSWVV